MGPDGVDFSVDDNYLEMTTSIAMEEGSDVIWAMSNFTNSNQSQYGHFVQKFDKNTGERLLDDFGKQVFPVNDLNYVGIGDLQVVKGKPFLLFFNGISNGANVVELGVVLLDENGNFAWEDEYVMIATGSGSKGRYDFTINYNGQSVATFTEVRNGVSKAYAQNYKVEVETAGNSEVHSLGLEVFPNPPTGMIKINSAKQIQKIEILNLAGSLLKTVNQSNQVDLGNLPKGVYIMKVTSLDDISKTTKVVRK